MMLLALVMSGALSSAACEGPFNAGAGKIGALRIGQVEQITAGNWPYRRSFHEDEGEGHDSYVVDVCPGVQIEAITDPGGMKIYELSTSSSAFVTPEGAHVGMSLAELKSRYPHGKLSYGDIEGRRAGFDTGRGVVFMLDYSGIPDICFDGRQECDRHFLSKRSLSLYTL